MRTPSPQPSPSGRGSLIGILLILFAPALISCGGGAAPGPAPVTVLAAASLEEVVREAAGEWSARSGRPVRLQFGASSALARSIVEGAPADVFLSADPAWLDEVKPLERFDWLSNRLVLVVPKEAPDVDLRTLPSLALGTEGVPAGKYARAALAHVGVPLPARVVYGASVRDVLSKVSSGAAAAGIVYATDVAVDPQVRVVLTFPEDAHPPIVYAVGLLAPEGRDLFLALGAPGAAEIARRRGFLVRPPP